MMRNTVTVQNLPGMIQNCLMRNIKERSSTLEWIQLRALQSRESANLATRYISLSRRPNHYDYIPTRPAAPAPSLPHAAVNVLSRATLYPPAA